MTEPHDAHRGPFRRGALALTTALLLPMSTALATTLTFNHTGTEQTWTVPAGITSATFDLHGAQGGTAFDASFGAGGLGGRATATLALTPGETIEIRVGGQGTTVGGYNGGGAPGVSTYPGGGGGATDVRQGGTSLGDRVLVAAGGGGSGACSGSGGMSSPGGAGGGLVGEDAPPADPGEACAELPNSGKGGTQVAGGAGGTGAGAGTLGQGGNADSGSGTYRGGGGGGYYGGGGGAGHSGGGGGSGFGPGGTVFETGVRSGDGLATIVFDSSLDVTTAGAGFVTSSPAGIDCETGSPAHPDCTALFTDGTPVTLSVTPAAGSVFLGWGGDCSGTAGCALAMDQARAVTATFGYLDFGDEADPTFPTLMASNGARHLLGSGVYLGACVDAELDGQPGSGADGDDFAGSPSTIGTCATPGDDEDGVVFSSQVVIGRNATVEVTANAGCTLSAWVDFNGDGDWTDAGEDLFPGGTVLTPGANSLMFAVPANALAGQQAARFRCTTAGVVSFTGEAPDGEVEDYRVSVVPSPAAAIPTLNGLALAILAVLLAAAGLVRRRVWRLGGC